MVVLSKAAAIVRADQTLDLLDAGASNAELELYSAGLSQLLITIPLLDPAFSGAVSGAGTSVSASLNLSSTVSALGTASGTAVSALWKDSNGLEVFRSSVGTANAELILTNNLITSSTTVEVTSFTWIEPTTG